MLLKRLWYDEAGFVLSAELILIGTLAVIGVTVGLHMASRAVNEELQEFSYAIRSLDQSYSVPGFECCGAWTAGSRYQQPDLAVSYAELGAIREREALPVRPDAEYETRPMPKEPRRERERSPRRPTRKDGETRADDAAI